MDRSVKWGVVAGGLFLAAAVFGAVAGVWPLAMAGAAGAGSMTTAVLMIRLARRDLGWLGSESATVRRLIEENQRLAEELAVERQQKALMSRSLQGVTRVSERFARELRSSGRLAVH